MNEKEQFEKLQKWKTNESDLEMRLKELPKISNKENYQKKRLEEEI